MTDNSGIGVYLSKNFGDEKYLGIPKNRMCEFKDSMQYFNSYD